jgi:ABC-2 type transport system ATP-binding protein
LTARELLGFYADLLGLQPRERKRQIEMVLDTVGLADRAGTKLRKYSKGMLQKLGIAQVLLGDPDLLVLDEPMSGLDPIGRRAVRELLDDLRSRGRTILLSSHIVPDVEALADEVALLREGLLVATHCLAELSHECIYEVGVSQLPQGDAAAEAIRSCRVVHGRRGDGPALVQSCTAADLARFLEVCSRTEVDVQSVQTRRHGLEDLFLRAMGEEKAKLC